MASQVRKINIFSRNHGAVSVTIWGGISSEGLTELAFLDGRQSSANYIKILEDHLLSFGEAYCCGESQSEWSAPEDNRMLTINSLWLPLTLSRMV